MKKTRICDLLSTKYPIIQGGMLWLATSELAASVSNAGAFGVISPLAAMEIDGDPAENLKIHLEQIMKITAKHFGVNIPLDLPYAGLLIDTILKEKVSVVIKAAGDPRSYTELLKKNGIIVLHVVSNVKQAMLAEGSGADAVIAEGIEATAHNGPDEIPLFALIPQIADAVSIPVIAAGGIVDTRGVVASMALGAEGVQLGTRFVVVKENIAHQNYKKAIIEASDTGTTLISRGHLPTRCLKTDFSSTLLLLEKSGASLETIKDFIGYRSN
jgi:enoyl-[acyl-carrier protein] reductase II